MVYTPFIWPLMIAAFLCIRIALYAHEFPDVPAARPFMWMMWLGVAWTLIYGLSILTVWYPLRVFLSMVMYIPTRLITPTILIVAAEYSGHEGWITRKNLLILLAYPIISIVASLTSPWHTLFRHGFDLDLAGPLPILHYQTGILFDLSNLYGSSLVILALLLLALSLRDRALEPKNTLLLAAGIFVPVLLDILFVLGITPIKGYSFAPSAIVLTGGAFLLALLKFHLFSFAPIARSTVFENLSDIVVVFDTRGQIIDYNHAAQENIGLEAKRSIGTSVNALPGLWKDFFETCILSGVGTIERELRTERGARIYDVSVTRIRDARDRHIGLLFMLHDISELRSSEQRISQLLSEKELLLREVHHRIKNNMSVIASILSLQSDTVVDPNARTALADARSRVHSMMVLYERLYRSDGVGELSMADYLSPLIDRIVGTFGNSSSVAVAKRIDDFTVPARILFSVGIIVNELITNAMKHAFPPGKSGTLRVAASRNAQSVSVQVEDDGGGFADTAGMESAKGFGLQLVRLMVKQIDGSLTCSGGAATRFSFHFPI